MSFDDMNGTLPVGEFGEKHVRNFFKKKGWAVEDLSHIREYQEKDIDMRVQPPAGNPLTIEVKTDRRILTTGNMFIEECMNRVTGERDGWLYTCEADILCYVILQKGVGLFLNWPAVKEMVLKGAGRKKTFVNPFDANCIGYGRLLSVKNDIRPAEVIRLEAKVIPEHSLDDWFREHPRDKADHDRY